MTQRPFHAHSVAAPDALENLFGLCRTAEDLLLDSADHWLLGDDRSTMLALVDDLGRRVAAARLARDGGLEPHPSIPDGAADAARRLRGRIARDHALGLIVHPTFDASTVRSD